MEFSQLAGGYAGPLGILRMLAFDLHVMLLANPPGNIENVIRVLVDGAIGSGESPGGKK